MKNSDDNQTPLFLTAPRLEAVISSTVPHELRDEAAVRRESLDREYEEERNKFERYAG